MKNYYGVQEVIIPPRFAPIPTAQRAIPTPPVTVPIANAPAIIPAAEKEELKHLLLILSFHMEISN